MELLSRGFVIARSASDEAIHSLRTELDCFAALAMTQNDAFSRRVRVRVLLHEQQKQKALDPIRRMAAGGGPGSISIAPGSQKIRKAKR